MIFCRLTSIIVALNKHEINNINILITHAAGYGQQLEVQIRCIIDHQELSDRQGDTINYHKVTRDGISKYKFQVSYYSTLNYFM